MGKQHLSRDDRIFMRGKLHGTRENMDMVAMVLMDKCGWHVQEETADSRDTQSIAYLYECLEKLAEEITAYYATEIDKYAIQTTQHNFPDTVQLGDAFQVREEDWTL